MGLRTLCLVGVGVARGGFRLQCLIQTADHDNSGNATSDRTSNGVPGLGLRHFVARRSFACLCEQCMAKGWSLGGNNVVMFS